MGAFVSRDPLMVHRSHRCMRVCAPSCVYVRVYTPSCVCVYAHSCVCVYAPSCVCVCARVFLYLSVVPISARRVYAQNSSLLDSNSTATLPHSFIVVTHVMPIKHLALSTKT